MYLKAYSPASFTFLRPAVLYFRLFFAPQFILSEELAARLVAVTDACNFQLANAFLIALINLFLLFSFMMK